MSKSTSETYERIRASSHLVYIPDFTSGLLLLVHMCRDMVLSAVVVVVAGVDLSPDRRRELVAGSLRHVVVGGSGSNWAARWA